MPSEFNPKIWWLELGMNDLGRTRCSEEVIILGVLRVVEEIVNKKPNANIVINSLLPMAEFRGGFEPNKWDFKDSFFKSIIAEDSKGNERRRLQEQTSRELRWFGIFGGDKSVKMSTDQTKQKKFKTLTRQKRKIPLFTSIYAINAVLRKFASKHDNVYFFDATNIFAEREERYWNLKTDMISTRGHPSFEGYKNWEKAVIEKAKSILQGGDP